MELNLNRILTIIIIFLASLFLISTIIVFATGKAFPDGHKHIEMTIDSPENIADSDNYLSYTAIGRIRTFTASHKDSDIGTSVIISPWFSYSKDDNQFFEEISRKAPQIKNIISLFFSNHTEKELKSMGEIKIKAELLKQLNEILVLNKIQSIYFSEFIFLN